jgi:hypothetical protein
VRAAEGHQAEADVLVREAVEIHPLLVHEPDAPNALISHNAL